MTVQISEVAEEERHHIGAAIRTYRELRGFTPDELAREIGISRPYLSNIEAGRKPLTDILLARLADKLAVRQIAICRAGYFKTDSVGAGR